MPFLYHRVPKKFHGKILYPMNELKSKLPKAYQKAKEKYTGRTQILKWKIPYLNCLWNDVLHLTPIHPSKIKKAQKEIGFESKKIKWFKINTNKINSQKIIIFLYKHKFKGNNIDKKNFIKYNSKEIPKYNKVPKKTKDYYSEMFKDKNKPLRFYASPHVFYKGHIKIEDVEIIEV